VKRCPLVRRNFLRGEIKDKAVSVYDCAYLGGLVIAQVKRVTAAGSLHSRDLRVPGHLVDLIVVELSNACDEIEMDETFRAFWSPQRESASQTEHATGVNAGHDLVSGSKVALTSQVEWFSRTGAQRTKVREPR
jgi:acyl CoA:acetate/3-ketoacid CoA transferase